MNKVNRIAAKIVNSPLLWGMLATVGFFTFLHSGTLASSPSGDAWEKFFRRYCAGHPIQYVETGMFFVGLAAIILKGLDLASQFKGVGEPLLESPPDGGQSAQDCPSLLERLNAAASGVKQSYLFRRLRDGIEHVWRSGSAETLDEHLKYLSDVDAARANSSSAFVRILIWAIPIMGFLGTVVGITVAIGNLSPEALEKSLPEVTAGLGVAFDTTALALVLSCVLMFGQFMVDRQEGLLLEEVDRRVLADLPLRFDVAVTGGDPQTAAVRRMAEHVVQWTEGSVRKQVELWQASLDAAEERWRQTTVAAQSQLQAALSGALAQNLGAHARQVAEAGRAAAAMNEQHWSGVQQALLRSVEAIGGQQQEMARQAEVLQQVVQATGQVTTLENALQRNLAALAGAHNFEATLESLAAVIHLLNARLGQMPGGTAPIGTNRNDARPLGHAA